MSNNGCSTLTTTTTTAAIAKDSTIAGEYYHESGNNCIQQQPQLQQQYDKINSSSRHSSKNLMLTVTDDGQRQVVLSTNITNQQQQQLLTLDKLENETISSKNANQSGTQSSSISNELNLQESALLRLTRVAEWVQNNHMDKIVEPISSHSASSMDGAASTDSGYKTKTNNNINNNNYHSPSIKNENFAQVNNNISSYNNNAQIDLAQMEYNVKQFLLKQNEWSIHNKVKQDSSINGSDIGGSITACIVSSSSVPITTSTTITKTNAITTKYLHRTETNL